MPRILRSCPYRPESVLLAGTLQPVREHQIIVWASLNYSGRGWHPRLPRIPMILDTGLSRPVHIRRDQLEMGAELSIGGMLEKRMVRNRGESLRRFEADIWLYRNVPGHRDLILNGPPFLLRETREITMCPAEDTQIRLPILGLPVLAENGLILTVNGVRRDVTLRTRFRPWPFTAP